VECGCRMVKKKYDMARKSFEMIKCLASFQFQSTLNNSNSEGPLRTVVIIGSCICREFELYVCVSGGACPNVLGVHSTIFSKLIKHEF